MSAPTYDDANVMLQLARWGSEAGLQDASSFLLSDEYEEDFEAFNEKFPWGSQEQKYATLICNWHETLAALWVNGLMNEKLISDWAAVGMVWNRIKNYALGIREQSGNPRIYEHFEALANALSD
jgi:hypothetical protein